MREFTELQQSRRNSLIGALVALATIIVALTLTLSLTPPLASAETPAQRCKRETAAYNNAWKAIGKKPPAPYKCGSKNTPPPAFPSTTSPDPEPDTTENPQPPKSDSQPSGSSPGMKAAPTKRNDPEADVDPSQPGITANRNRGSRSICDEVGKTLCAKIELLSSKMPDTTPRQVLDDARRWAAATRDSLENGVDKALHEVRKLASNPGDGGDDGYWTSIPSARKAADIFYSDAETYHYEHGHNGIYTDRNTTVQALDKDRGVQLVPANDPKHKVKNPRLMIVVSLPEVRSKAVQWALSKPGSGYNSNFAFNRRDWKDGESATYNCSQLVWGAYMNGSDGSLDIDGDGGPGVYPIDIVDSPKTMDYM